MASSFFDKKIAPVKKLKRRLAGIGGSLTVKLKKELSRRGMDNSKALRNSIKHRTSFKSGFTGVNITVEMEGYGGFLNKNLYARSPITPNLDAIMAWMTSKGVEPGNFKNGKQMTLRQAAYVISRSISKKGYFTFNKYKQGWVDMVYAKEAVRLEEKTAKWVTEAMIEVERMEFKFLKLAKKK